jgi:Eco57I restriction-modification methylase
MNRTKLKTYAPQARRDFITAVTDRAAYYGLTRDRIETMTEQGDVVIIAGTSLPRHIAAKRKRLEERITRQGFEHTMEAIAYTWFNRFAAIRFMELHGYLEHGYRVLSHPDPEEPTPEILEHAEHVDLPGLNQTTVIDLKLEGTRETELYRMLLMAQCNALHAAMPFLFERIDDETELLLPDNLLHSDSLIRKLVNGIDEADWQEVEIIGWLYQFYISEKKDQVIGKVVKSEDIPAATQLFTPNWIVKYLVQNSLGRQWLAAYPDSPLKQQMEYYIEPAEQTLEVQTQLKAITPESLNPEELTLLDPACGSGHILVEAYALFKAIYQERGYRARDIPSLILQKNLYGLEIDDRAAQLAAFALMMKARADDRRIFANGIQPHVLAIQESKGLDAKKITEALNVPILKTELLPSEYLFEELEEERSPLFSRKNLSVKGDIAQADVAQLIALFEHGKTFGSLIRVPEELVKKLPAIAERVQDVLAYGGMLEQTAARSLRPLIELVWILVNRYNAVITNPPYMGGKYFNGRLKEFIAEEYKEGKADLYACFILRNLEFTKSNSFVGMITIPNWMFLSSFERVRQSLFDFQTIDSFIHNGRGVFGSDFGSCSFVLRNQNFPAYRGVFRRLFEKQGSVASNEELERKFFEVKNYFVSPANFKRIPGSPVAYWASETVRLLFARHKPLDEIADLRQGMSSGNGEKYVRHWHEVNFTKCQLPVHEMPLHHSQILSKWYPYNKGGPFRKWYGNRDYVIDFENDGETMKNDAASGQNKGYRMVSKDWFFKSGITRTDVSSTFLGARSLGPGFIFENTGSMVFPCSAPKEAILGFLCSKMSSHLMGILNPTVHFTVGEIKKLPFSYPGDRIIEVVNTLIQKHEEDWDCMETSWDFQHSSLLFIAGMSGTVEAAFEKWTRHCSSIIAKVRILEEENNRHFIEAYGLQDELSPEVPEDQITLYRPNREEDIKRLISYAIGCMMGRYSLDKPGLIYAHSGNTGFDPSQYQTFPADEDGIIPVMETDWFPDDASNRLVEFISVAWPREHLAGNLTFIADSLGPNHNEQPRDTIRRYLSTGFYKHHLSMYKRRPIYWLFSSGKQRAFQCLVYLHRYHEGTLSRMRTEYVIPLQGKMASRLDQLADDIAAASSTAHRKRLEKERDTLRKHHTELQAFDEQLRHYADQRISLDLDDGVKVNYGKFGDLLAEVKAITGGTMDEAP